jgi:[ribulose-bisphosphate carboxylase]-lysine N-methyltransferase
VQWGEADLAELQGSQLLGSVQGYQAYFKQRYEALQAELFGPNAAVFDPAVFTFDAFLWAACTVRARSHSPLEGANIALVPLADTVRSLLLLPVLSHLP